MISDAELLRRYAQQDDQEAFTELVRRHVDFVYAAARRQCRCEHRAEDVTQMVFTDLARKAASLCERDELLGWLFISTRFAAARIARDEGRRDLWERNAAMEDELTKSGQANADWEQLRPQLDAALGALREADRAAILLRVFKGCSFADVGAALRISEEAARKRVDRALEKLRLVLARRGITSTAAALAMAISSQAAMAAPAGLATQIAGVAVANAVVAGAAGTVFEILQIMTTTKMVAGAAVIAASLAMGTAVYEVRQQSAAETASAQAVRESAAQMAQTVALKDRIARAENERAGLEKATGEARTAAGKSAGSVSVPRGSGAQAKGAPGLSPERAALAAQLARGAEFLAAHPEARETLREQWRSSRAVFNQLLYKDLDLTPAQIQGVEKFLMEDSSTTCSMPDGEWVALSLKDNPTLGTPEQAAERRKQLQEVLGSEKAARWGESWSECHSAVTARMMAGQVAGAVYFTDTPLTSAQASSLADIFLKNSPEYQAGKAFFGANLDWDKTLTDAKNVLSEQQFEALNALRLRQEYNKQYQAALKTAALSQAGGSSQ